MSTRTPPRRMADAIHVVLGDTASGSNYRLSIKDYVILRDPLCPGPCDPDPTTHHRKRKRFWDQVEQSCYGPPARKRKTRMKPRRRVSWITGLRSFNAKLASFAENKPVILWTMTSWRERLSLWWALDALKRTSFDLKRCWLGEPRRPGPFSADDYLYCDLGRVSPEFFITAFEALVPLRSRLARTGASLWRQFASSWPLAFDRSRREGRIDFPELAKIGERYGRYFPQVADSEPSRLKLSERDQMLLDSVETNAWMNAVEIMTRRKDLVHQFICDGDMVFAFRLHQWAKHQRRRPAVEVRPGRKGNNPYINVEYRLTPLGDRLRNQGLQTPDEAPSMFIGGCKLYSTERTWVRRVRGNEWWIEEWVG